MFFFYVDLYFMTFLYVDIYLMTYFFVDLNFMTFLYVDLYFMAQLGKSHNVNVQNVNAKQSIFCPWL